MKNNLILRYIRIDTARLLFAFIALQFPLISYCDTVNGWFKDSIESKGKSMKEVAVKVAELHEEKDIEIWGLDFSPDGRYLAATSPNTLEIQIWDWQNKRIVRTLEKAQGAGLTTDIRYSPDGHLLIACHSRAADYIVARIWSTDTWEIVHNITNQVGGGGCNAIGFTPDGKSLVGLFGRTPTKPGDNLIIYDTATWQPIWGLRTVPFHPNALSISSNGEFAAIGGPIYDSKGGETQQIALVDLIQHIIVRTIPNTLDFSYGGRLAWSPDGVQLTAMGMRAWDGRPNVLGWDGKIHPQGAFISGPDTVMVFDAHNGKQITGEQLVGVGHASLCYTPDGKYLIEGDMDGLGKGLGVRIWDGQHRELLQEIPGNVGSLAVSRDSHHFAMSIGGKTIIWQLK